MTNENPPITSYQQLENSQTGLDKLREAVAIFGGCQWPKVMSYLKLYNIHLDNPVRLHQFHDVWQKKKNSLKLARQNQQDLDNYWRTMINHNFNYETIRDRALRDKITQFHTPNLIIHLLNSTLKQLGTHFYRKKQAFMKSASKNGGCVVRLLVFRRYFSVLDIESNNSVITKLQHGVSQFKKLLHHHIEVNMETLNRSQSFAAFMKLTCRREVEMIIEHLYYLDECQKIYENIPTEQWQLNRCTSIMPLNTKTIKQSEEYQLIFTKTPNERLFDTFMEARQIEIIEKEQNESFIFNPFCDQRPTLAKTPKTSNPKQVRTKKVYHDRFSDRRCRIFNDSIVRELEEQDDNQDSFENIVLIPQKEDVKLDKVDMMLQSNKHFQDFYNENLRNFKQEAYSAYCKQYGLNEKTGVRI